MQSTLRIALATPRCASSVDEALQRVEQHIADAAAQDAEIVCFPEAYVPGLRGLDFDVPEFDKTRQDDVLSCTAEWAKSHRIAVILGLETYSETGRNITAAVVNAEGSLQGFQAKNQLDPTEEPYYQPGHGRQLFSIHDVPFGIVICHEGFRYPETVRWAAQHGAKIVFHPHCTGSDKIGPQLTRWCAADAPYYEKAMMCRALENTVYFAGVNYAFRYQESATCVIDPDGQCVECMEYGKDGVLVQTLDLKAATGLLASRYAPERFGD